MGRKAEVSPKAQFQKCLNKAMEESGFSINRLAKELCVSRQSVSAWKNGKSEPSATHIVLACKAMGISPVAFWGWR